LICTVTWSTRSLRRFIGAEERDRTNWPPLIF